MNLNLADHYADPTIHEEGEGEAQESTGRQSYHYEEEGKEEQYGESLSGSMAKLQVNDHEQEHPQEEHQAEGDQEDADPELLDKDAVLIFFNQIGISDETKTVLLKNGFDNFESLSYISRDVLDQLHIRNEEDADTLLNSLASIAE